MRRSMLRHPPLRLGEGLRMLARLRVRLAGEAGADDAGHGRRGRR